MVNKQRTVSRIPSPELARRDQPSRTVDQDPRRHTVAASPAGRRCSVCWLLGCRDRVAFQVGARVPCQCATAHPPVSVILGAASDGRVREQPTRAGGWRSAVACRVLVPSCGFVSATPFSPHVLARFPVEEASTGTRHMRRRGGDNQLTRGRTGARGTGKSRSPRPCPPGASQGSASPSPSPFVRPGRFVSAPTRGRDRCAPHTV